MIQGILDGVVDAIATDHAPQPAREGRRVRARAQWHHRAGNCARPGPEMAAPRVEAAAGPRPEPDERAASCAARPQRPRHAGRGQLADVVVFDPQAEWTYRATESKSKAKTPRSMAGRCRAECCGRSAKGVLHTSAANATLPKVQRLRAIRPPDDLVLPMRASWRTIWPTKAPHAAC